MQPSYSIIYVPGIRPKPRPELHEAQLQSCLEAGIIQVGGDPEIAAEIAATLKLVGWSHDFYGEHKDITTDLPGIERLLRFEGSVQDDIREATSIKRRIVSWLYALADYFPVLGSYLSTRRMQLRVSEIKRYFADSCGEAGAARAMLAEVLSAAWARQERVLLIGHSFGSVIAYDTLWELSREADCGQVNLFMTMGSPLTLNFINHHLKGAHERGPGRYPKCIRRWINLAAVGEVTALDRKLSTLFKEMRTLGIVDSIEDDLNVINRFHENDYLNVHKCYGYMASSEVSKLVLEWYEGA